MPVKLGTRFHSDNISAIYASTAVAMIFTALTGVISVLIEGIITSRFLGSEIYSGIALLRPFNSAVLMLSSFLATGCNVACSHLVGRGEKEKANETFNLSAVLGLIFAAVLIFACIAAPDMILKLCGVTLTKYPELNPHMYGYLHGYMIGLPALLLIEVIGPILVMDGGKALFSVSSAVLCIAEILGDLLNAFVFHGGAFGVGLATSCGFVLQLLVLLTHFIRPKRFFRLSLKNIRRGQLAEIARGGSPSLVKRAAGTLKDILINHLNLMAALTTAAIAARGIQSDLFQFLFCIATGLGRALVTMSGMYHSANDLNGLKRLYSYAMKFGIQITVAASAVVFIAARPLTGIYSSDQEVIDLAVFSIRWMAAGLVFDTISAQLQHYLQGIKRRNLLNALCLGERFLVPVMTAYVLGGMYGSKGILASTGIAKFVLIVILLLFVCFRNKSFPTRWEHVMFLSEDFGGAETDNLYAVIRNPEDAVLQSERTRSFCLEHGADERKAFLMALCAEEMTINILDHAQKVGKRDVSADYRLFVSDGRICFSLRDLSDHFDPTAFYQLHQDEDGPEAHLGIRMVTKIAKEVTYFSAFNSNNLIIYID